MMAHDGLSAHLYGAPAGEGQTDSSDFWPRRVCSFKRSDSDFETGHSPHGRLVWGLHQTLGAKFRYPEESAAGGQLQQCGSELQ